MRVSRPSVPVSPGNSGRAGVGCDVGAGVSSTTLGMLLI